MCTTFLFTDRAVNIQVRVGDIPMGGFASTPLDPQKSSNTVCHTFSSSPLDLITHTQCKLKGRFVSVQAVNSNMALNLAEIEVWKE